MAVRQQERSVVYIVDSDAAVRTDLARLLRNAGLDPRPYACVERFLDEVRASPRACILLDLTLPQMASPEVRARIRKQLFALPVIAVSPTDAADSARNLGARLFLRKPVDEQALMDAIHWVIPGNNER